MASLFNARIERIAEDAVHSYFASAELKARLALIVRWVIHGFEPGYGVPDRVKFTQTVADRIKDKARKPVYLFGYRVWSRRVSDQFAATEAEKIVTDFLIGEKILFGDPRYTWADGYDLADDEMSYWDASA